MSFERFTSMLGAMSDDPVLIAAFSDLGVLRLPAAPTFFNSPYEVPFRLSKHGLLLGFQDINYVNNAPPRSHGRGGLQLRSVAATSGIAGEVRRYSGALPGDIVWNDGREAARTKMLALGDEAGILHAGSRDSWWKENRYRVIAYQPGRAGAEDENGVFEIAEGLFLPFSQPMHDLSEREYPSVSDLIGCFGQPSGGSMLVDLFRAFSPETWEWETHMNFSREYGFEIYFDESQNASNGGKRFVGIDMKRDRLGPSTAWLGALPFGLKWDDSIHDVIARIGRPADVEDIGFDVWGWAKWFMEDHLFWVNFDTMRNRLETIAVMDLEYERTRPS